MRAGDGDKTEIGQLGTGGGGLRKLEVRATASRLELGSYVRVAVASLHKLVLPRFGSVRFGGIFPRT